MERLQQFLKKHLFWEGVACGVVACVWVYGTFIKEGYEQVKLKYDLLEKECDKKAVFEDKYRQEQLHTHELEIKKQNLQSDLENSENRYKALADLKWEEKFNAEHLARISSEEQLASAQGRVSGLSSERDQKQKDYDTLLVKLESTERERDALKKLYTGGTAENRKPQSISTPTNKTDADSVLAALNGIYVLDAGNFVISAVPKISGGIPPNVFINMLGKVYILHRSDVVIKVAKYIQRPISAEQMSQISQLLPATEAGDAMQSLVQP